MYVNKYDGVPIETKAGNNLNNKSQVWYSNTEMFRELLTPIFLGLITYKERIFDAPY